MVPVPGRGSGRWLPWQPKLHRLLLEADYAGAEAQVAAIAVEGVDVDALGESLQRQGAKAFSADWAALVEAIGAKVAGG